MASQMKRVLRTVAIAAGFIVAGFGGAAALLAGESLNNDKSPTDRAVVELLRHLEGDRSIKIGELLEPLGVNEICLVASDLSSPLKVGNTDKCEVSIDALVLIERSGQCQIIDLSPVSARILSGSVESQCKPFSPRLTIQKVDRYGQQHLIFEK